MLAYHGTGTADGILEVGFDPEHPLSWGSEEGALCSLGGGMYCALNAGDAVSHAIRAAMEFGGTPSLVVLDVVERDIRADEDHLSALLLSVMGRTNQVPKRDRIEVIARQMNEGRTPTENQVAAVQSWAEVAVTMLREESDDPDADFESYRQQTEQICDLFPWTGTIEFVSAVGAGPVSFRVVGLRAPAERSETIVVNNEDRSQIVNVIDIEISVDGLELVAIRGRFGDVDDDVREEIAEAWADDVEKRVGTRPSTNMSHVEP